MSGEELFEVAAAQHETGGRRVRPCFIRHSHAEQDLDVPVDVTCSQRLEDHSPTWPMYCKLPATPPNDAHRRWRLPEALQRLPGDQGSYLDEASKAFGVGESKRRRLRMSHAP